MTLNLTGDEIHTLRVLLERLREFRFPRPGLLGSLKTIEKKLKTLDERGREGER